MIDEIVRILWKRIGLDPGSVGLSCIERAVQLRVLASGVTRANDYLDVLRSNADEMQALIEAVVVPETWFFRNPGAFSAAIEHVRTLPRLRKLRFLCVPCSTGEEPFSLAMALLDAGFARSAFQIDAVDVSARVLRHAAAGVYGRNSFRGENLEFRDRHFKQTAEGLLLSREVRDCVQFHQGNLLDEIGSNLSRDYDVIFCRNLLIYFDSPTQDRAITTLHAMLAADGMFCVGPAETALLTSHDFTQVPAAAAFAFRKGRQRPPLPQQRSSQRARVTLTPSPRLKSAPKTGAVKPVSVTPPATPTVDLSHAARLADEGRLAEVATICQASVRQCGASAQAFFLLGLVSDAQNLVESAVGFYRKALYLDPQHHDTLLHYAILAARRGDRAAADALRDRARRASEKSGA